METDTLQYENLQNLFLEDDVLLTVANTLLGLQGIPNADAVGTAIKNELHFRPANPKLRPIEENLKKIYKRVVLESSPDYWIDQVLENEDIDSSKVDMTFSLANERQQQAKLIAAAINRIDSTSEVEEVEVSEGLIE